MENEIIYYDVYIHWRDVQRKNVVNNVDMSSVRTPWQNDPYKNIHTEQHKDITRVRVVDIHLRYLSSTLIVMVELCIRTG